ncbi:uncharacterized protein TNCT_328061 [Trichonephila clavata]|uniref:Uncharacterized protein n=1 Tax=Trichonephila clavata TaxID=2740835 RepID=A0A8X6GYJ0_TRICU|nr:uncharacterized protein TNCT_328061 [Trichonephila clavata]
MEAYSTLVDLILNAPVLANKVQDMVRESEHTSLNLVTLDWKSQLANNARYQQFLKDAKFMFSPERLSLNSQFRVQNLKDSDTPLKVIMVGVCNVYRPYTKATTKLPLSITIKDSPLMNMLTKAITSDVDPNKARLSDTVKVNFGTCSLYCHHCSNAMDRMASKGVKLNFDCVQPCIADINVFNGETLVNRFGDQIKSYFPDTFIAIMEIELNVRYFYALRDASMDMVRVGGRILKMVAFPESNLKQTNVCLGDLNLLAQVEPNQDQYFVPPEYNGSSENRSLEDDELKKLWWIVFPASTKKLGILQTCMMCKKVQ